MATSGRRIRGDKGTEMSKHTTSISYREFSPSAQAAAHVLCYWEFTVHRLGPEPYQHHIPPDGCTSIAIRYPPEGGSPLVILFGPRLESYEVLMDQPIRYFGCRFQPHAAAAFFRLTGESLFNVSEPAAMRLPEFTQALVESLPKEPEGPAVARILDERIRDRLAEAAELDELAKLATSRIVHSGGQAPMAQVAADLGVNARQLQRRFRAATGLTPKQFARIRRFREAVAEVLVDSPRPWIDVAYEVGYADQAHLAREFSQLVGLTAEELRKKHEVIQHEDVDP